jgi:Uma2 family endonuclease
MTPEEYLAFERASEQRHEYLAGEVFAMGGASRLHNLIVTNLVRELSQKLKDRPCFVYANDLRVEVDADEGLYTYPDVVVVCGEQELRDDHEDTLLNPAVIFEVLSPSTESYDRGEKFTLYRKLPSLTEYVLVSQSRPLVEHFVRRPDGQWLLSDAAGLAAVVELPALECRVELAEIYDKVEWATRRGVVR